MSVAIETAPEIQLKQREFEIPSEGPHKLVLQTYRDLGPKTTTWQGKTTTRDMVRLVFLVEGEKGKDGSDLLVFQQVSQSLDPKSNMFKLLQSLGIVIGKSFQLLDLIGVTFTAEIEHNVAKDGSGKVYANLGSIVRRTVILPPACRPKIQQV